MIRFNSKPDKVFTKIITDMLEEAIDLIGEDILSDDLNFTYCYFENELINAFGGGIDGAKLILEELKKLLQAHKSTEIYMPTDRHFQLLDRILRHFCDIYNDRTRNILSNPKQFKKCGSLIIQYKKKAIKKLAAEALMDIFFWDNDYDIPTETALSMTKPQNKKVRKMGDFSDEAVGASLYLPVDGPDLRIKLSKAHAGWTSDEHFPWHHPW